MAKKIFKTMDGNEAAAYIAYAFTDCFHLPDNAVVADG